MANKYGLELKGNTIVNFEEPLFPFGNVAVFPVIAPENLEEYFKENGLNVVSLRDENLKLSRILETLIKENEMLKTINTDLVIENRSLEEDNIYAEEIANKR